MKGKLIYKRVLLKISGEALAGKNSLIDSDMVEYVVEEVACVLNLGVQLGLVVGGGNFFRGLTLSKEGLDRITGDNMGMIATVINALRIRDIFNSHREVSAEIMSAIPMDGIVKGYERYEAIKLLEKGNVVIFAGGTGNPLVSTDSALSLRGIEMKADLLLKATKVDGIYSADPRKNSNAKKYDVLTYNEVLDKKLAVMDAVALHQCCNNGVILKVFNLYKKGALLKVILGEKEGTTVIK